MASPSIRRIERLNYGISAAVILLALITQPRDVVLGVAVGAGLTCANFWVLRRIIVKWTGEVATGKAGNSSLFMLPKMLVLMGAVAVAILVLPLDVIAFTIGYSIFIVSIIVDTVYASLRTEPSETTNESDHG
jgi:ATP synthase I subunit